MQDANGSQIQVGDHVHIAAKVKQIGKDGTLTCETVYAVGPEGQPGQLTVAGAAVIVRERADGSLVEPT